MTERFQKRNHGITAAQISDNPDQYFGKKVINYSGTEAAETLEWRIFYADDKNIYLISDEPIDDEKFIPKGKGGTNSTKSQYGSYYSFEEVLEDYTLGSADITERSQAKNWISWVEDYPTSVFPAIKASAYLLDTIVWNPIYVGQDAEYAVGCPTLELYLASYKKIYPNTELPKFEKREYGYEHITEISGVGPNNIYRETCIASPAMQNGGLYSDGIGVFELIDMNTRNGILSIRGCTKRGGASVMFSIRPIICLKEGVILEEKEGDLAIL